MKVSVSGFKDILEVLNTVSSEDTADEISDAAAILFKSDVLDWINGGNSFTTRSGNLVNSIQAAINLKGISEIMAGNNKAFYATSVEFGSKRSKPYPFIYADLDNRLAHILDKSIEIIRRKINVS